MHRFLILLMLGSVAFSAQAAPPGPVEDWNLVWSDEFNGGSLDTSKWRYFDGWGQKPWREAYYSPDQVRLENGNLVIAANQKDGRFATGGILTQGLFEPAYGYYEIRCRFAELEAHGLWVAFIMRFIGETA